MAGDHRDAANAAFIGAILFVVSALLYIDAYAIDQNARDNAPGGMAAYKTLNITNLQAHWAGRRDAQLPFVLAETTGAIAWFSLMIPVQSLVALFAQRSATFIVIACFTAVAIIMLINLTFQLGTLSVTDWISNWPLLMDAEAHSHDGGFGPLQALEISYLVGQSRWIWLFAMDMLLLSIGWSAVTFLIFSARRELEKPPHLAFAFLSFVGAVVSFAGVFLDISRVLPSFDWVKMNYAAAVATTLVYMFILPIWLVWLGMLLRQRSETIPYNSNLATPQFDVEMTNG